MYYFWTFILELFIIVGIIIMLVYFV